MAYAFKLDRPAGADVRRIAVKQLDAAVADLAGLPEGGAGDGGEELLHDARKRLKKVRALLRLVRGAVGPELFAEQDARLRDAGRRLAPLRDAQALAQVADGLRAEAGGTLTGRVFDALQAGLRQRQQEERERMSDGSVPAAVRATLQEATACVRAWPLEEDGFALFAEGLRREYRSGRRRMHRARDAQHDVTEDLESGRAARDIAHHQWRKRVKGHWYHVRLLAPAWPAVLDARAGELGRLADLLGADHDLAVLGGLAPQLLRSPDDLAGLGGILEARQRSLRREAHLLGSRLYAGKPGGELRRLRAAYDAATRPGAGPQ